MKGFRPPEPSCSTMLAVVSTSIVTGDGAGQTHRNHSFWKGRSRAQLAERMHIV